MSACVCTNFLLRRGNVCILHNHSLYVIFGEGIDLYKDSSTI
jgi:hypothetical protein